MTRISIGILLCLSVAAHAQTTKISGKIANWKTAGVTQLTNQGEVDVPVKVSEGGRFAVVLPELQQGFYHLQGIGDLYLQMIDALRVGPGKDSDYVFTGKGSLENNLAVQAKKMFRSYFRMGPDGFLFETYKIEPDSFVQKLDAYKAAAHLLLDRSPSEPFKTMAKKDVDFYCLNRLNDFLIYYGVDSAKQQQYFKIVESGHKFDSAMFAADLAIHVKRMTPKQMLKIDSLRRRQEDWNDSSLFKNSAQYRDALSIMIMFSMYKEFQREFLARKDQTLIKIAVIDKHVSDPYIRNYYHYTFTGDIIKMSKDSVLKDSIYRSFIASPDNQAYRSKILELYTNYIDFADNKLSPGFSYNDVAGKNVSLENLRGKYVYIDVWATWCGPCKGEIPHLAKVEQDYQGRNIQFVSLSVDVPSDKGKWQEFVRVNRLSGIQLMSDSAFDSGFIKKFNINSIPRFILIAPDGKIVSADAKRPSDPVLRKQLDALLSLK